MWNSGCGDSAAAPRKRAFSWSSFTWSPFHVTVPSKSMSISTTVGGTGGGGGLPTGMLSFTACVWIGMVMISMMSSTSITSMSGVVLMSTITSGSAELPVPTVIAMCRFLSRLLPGDRPDGGLGDEPDLEDRGALAGRDDAADRFVAHVLVRADVHLGLGLHHRDLLEAPQELLVVLDVLHVPEHVAVLVDRDDDVLGLGLGGDVALLGKHHRHLLDHHGNGDEEDDQQHKHHVDERRGVDGGHHVLLALADFLSDGHCHDSTPRARPGLPRGGDRGGRRTLRLHPAADEDHVQVGAERAQLLERDLVAAD